MSTINVGTDHLYPKVELAGTGVDTFTGAQGVISEPHLLGHQGKMFHASIKVTGILDAGIENILFKVPAGVFPHLHKTRTNVGAGDVDIVSYEGTTVSADGAAVTVDNTNRNSSNTPDMTIFTGPTITGDGTEIHRLWLPPAGVGIGRSAIGLSGAEAGEEWVLKPATNYLHRLTNNSGSTISAWFEFLFYEV